jgi:hypothetical protein
LVQNIRHDQFEVEWDLRLSSRAQLREAVVQKFLQEKPGYWKNGIKHVTTYKYFVEKAKDGRRLYLLRPTFLNKGIDFQVWVERLNEVKDIRPSHQTVFRDLKLKRSENPMKTDALLDAIDLVWLCTEPDVALAEIGDPSLTSGMPSDLLLKILKWLFIEQDLTYWNYDGRGMLRLAINTELGKRERPKRFNELFPEV